MWTNLHAVYQTGHRAHLGPNLPRSCSEEARRKAAPALKLQPFVGAALSLSWEASLSTLHFYWAQDWNNKAGWLTDKTQPLPADLRLRTEKCRPVGKTWHSYMPALSGGAPLGREEPHVNINTYRPTWIFPLVTEFPVKIYFCRLLWVPETPPALP